jgi:CubicO group peptidase (beta-lactamase class C family)
MGLGAVGQFGVPDELPAVEPVAVDQPVGVEWPTIEWPRGAPSSEVDALVDVAFGDPKLHETYAVLVVAEGRIIAERYGVALPSFTHPPVPVVATTKLLSWSMAKSFLHAACGLLVDGGRLDPEAPAPIAAWRGAGDPRGAITLRQLLQMRDGLDWLEDYVDDRRSDVIEMLFGDAKDDVAAYAAGRPLAHPPGSTFNYSSGTSNLVASIVGDVVGRGAPTEAFLRDRLFAPLGMGDAHVTLDAVGTFIGSSYLYCTARAMAKFATLYLRGGCWEGRQLLSAAWASDAQLATSRDVEPTTYYSHHWWLDGRGTYWASGYEGQRAVIVPAANSVFIRYGATPDADAGDLRAWCDELTAALLRR